MEFRKLSLSISLFIATIMAGTFGYHYFEAMTFFESLYMTAITISTVGFSEIRPLSETGRILTIFIIATGIGTGTYTLGIIVKIFVEGEIQRLLGRRKLDKTISELKNHFIICGFGRIGKIICEELSDDKKPFIVIEQNEHKIAEIEEKKYLYLNMDATSEEALSKAGIKKAKAVVTAVSSDADNVYITLTAKGQRSDIFVLSRASDDRSMDNLKRAGATRVISPYHIGARRMAQVLKRPTVMDFLDTAMMESNLGLVIDELIVGPNSHLIGRNLIDSRIRKDYGVIIVAIKPETGSMIFNPEPTQKLSAGDVIVVLGKKQDLTRMTDIL